MNKKTCSKVRRFLLIALVAGLASGPVNAAIYVEIPDIPGGSMDANHTGWIEALTIGGNFEERVCGDFIITAEVDRAFPLLAAAVVSGNAFSKIVVDFTEKFNGVEWTIATFTLDRAVITTLATHFVGDDATIPAQQITVRSSMITIYYVIRDATGAPLGNLERAVECGKTR